MKDLIRRLQPDCFEDIVALVALFRPGTAAIGDGGRFHRPQGHERARIEYPIRRWRRFSSPPTASSFIRNR